MDSERVLPDGAIGFADQMSQDDLSGKHVDSLTKAVFETEEAYLNHVNPITGHTPQEPEHLGAEFLAIQKAALERGADKISPEDIEQKARQDEAIEQVAAAIETAPVQEQPQQQPVTPPVYQA